MLAIHAGDRRNRMHANPTTHVGYYSVIVEIRVDARN